MKQEYVVTFQAKGPIAPESAQAVADVAGVTVVRASPHALLVHLDEALAVQALGRLEALPGCVVVANQPSS